MVVESNQNVFLIQIDASRFAEFEISEFEISRFDCILVAPACEILCLPSLKLMKKNRNLCKNEWVNAEKLAYENYVVYRRVYSGLNFCSFHFRLFGDNFLFLLISS